MKKKINKNALVLIILWTIALICDIACAATGSPARWYRVFTLEGLLIFGNLAGIRGLWD